MNVTQQPARLPAHLTVVLTLSRLLERLERSPEPVGADQYRSVVEHLGQALQEAPVDEALQALLDAHPAAAELYENLNYQHAGLCRSPLDRALAAELQARDVLRSAAKV
jgi:hypothetical protein